MTDEQTLRKHFIPMTETGFYILLALVSEQHGYGIMQTVDQITSGRIRLGAGTLYGTLQKLEKEKLIRATAEVERRKLYILTELGRTLLNLELDRLDELLKNGRRAMGGI